MALRRIKKAAALLLAAAAAAVAFGCGEDLSGIPDKPVSETTIIADFSLGAPGAGWHAADWSNDPGLFGCVWRPENVVFDGGVMALRLEREDGEEYSGEYRTNGVYGHGYYSVSMKPLAADGVISSFFTYTNRPQWDEIDIEFLGDDTTRVQFNYYTDGKGGHEFVYDLGFDASEDFHTYGFEWLENGIVWYVDEKPVHRATADMPVSDAQIMMNLWNIAETGPQNWAGVYGGAEGCAYYEWVGFDPA